MPDLEILSRPLRRVLTEWLSRLVDRLLHFQYQLRNGLIRMVSSSVAETIEEQLHRPFKSRPSSDYYEESDYCDYDEAPATPRLAYSTATKSSDPSHTGWRTVFSRAADMVLQWLQHPWVEPVVAGGITLVSLLLLLG